MFSCIYLLCLKMTVKLFYVICRYEFPNYILFIRCCFEAVDSHRAFLYKPI